MKVRLTRDNDVHQDGKYIDGINFIMGADRDKVLDFFVSVKHLKQFKNLVTIIADKDEDINSWGIRVWIFNVEYTAKVGG